MRWDFQVNTQPVARKSYKCDASLAILDYMREADFTPDELLCFQGAKADGFKITKGMQYDKVSGMFDGEFSVWRARLDMLSIYNKYKLWQE